MYSTFLFTYFISINYAIMYDLNEHLVFFHHLNWRRIPIITTQIMLNYMHLLGIITIFSNNLQIKFLTSTKLQENLMPIFF
jgi:hypothetical protein